MSGMHNFHKIFKTSVGLQRRCRRELQRLLPNPNAWSKTLHEQNPPVFDSVDLYNGRETLLLLLQMLQRLRPLTAPLCTGSAALDPAGLSLHASLLSVPAPAFSMRVHLKFLIGPFARGKPGMQLCKRV